MHAILQRAFIPNAFFPSPFYSITLLLITTAFGVGADQEKRDITIEKQFP
jgi:hypothetical protein